MDWHREIRDRLERLSLRPEREAEIVDELSQHLAEQVRERVAGGLALEAARREALDELDVPGALAARLASLEVRVPLTVPPVGAPAKGRWLTQIRQDVRLALRTLRRRPAFAAAVLATLALTIGPATAIVSVGNWLLWTPSPAIAAPERLVVLWVGMWRGPNGVSPRGVSYANLADLRSSSQTLAGLAGWQESAVSVAATGVTPRPVQGGFVTANFFDVLGVRLEAGRVFTVEEDRPPFGAPVIVVSHALARQAFGTPDAALGQTFQINGRPMTVIGVTPRSFGGATPTSQVDVWYTGAAYPYVNHGTLEWAQQFNERADGVFYTFIGRLNHGATGESAEAELATLVPALAERYPDDNGVFKEARARVFQGLGPMALTRTRLAGLVRGMLIGAAVLLLLGCANISNLLLSNGIRQRSEFAVRLALGASRSRLVRQVLAQSVVLSILGAALGVGLAFGLKQLIQVLLLPSLARAPLVPTVPIDAFVLWTTLGAAVLCGLLAGVTPAVFSARAEMSSDAMRGAARSLTRSSRVRTTLAAVQLGLSLALVTGAGLLVASMRNLGQVDLGFVADGVIAHTPDPSRHGYTPERSRAYANALFATLANDPSIDAVSLSTNRPFGSGSSDRVVTPGGDAAEAVEVRLARTSPTYVDVLGLTLLHGRYFNASEAEAASAQDLTAVAISESLARALFDRAEVIGQRFEIARRPRRQFQVVGVVADARTRDITGPGERYIYMPMEPEEFQSWFVVMTRSRAAQATVDRIVERASLALDPSLPIGSSVSLHSEIRVAFGNTRVLAWVLSLLSAVGFPLAAIGLYGLLSQAVTERRREFGVRMAIGASARAIARLVFRQAAWTSAFGIVVGLAMTVWGTTLVRSALFGVSEFDWRVYAASVGVLVTVVFVATLWPAWSATRVNPIETLRSE